MVHAQVTKTTILPIITESTKATRAIKIVAS